MINHVSLDFDGVVIDSLECMEYAWTQSCGILDIDKSFSDYIPYIGIPFDKILENLDINPSKTALLTRSYNVLSSSRIDLVQIYPNMKEILNFLNKAKVATSLVTSKSRNRTYELLDKLNLRYFDAIITPDDVQSGKGKPCADPLILACKQVDRAPSTTIYIGDMKSDFQCANSAGSLFCYASWGYGDKFWKPPNSMCLSTPNDLKSYLTKILSPAT